MTKLIFLIAVALLLVSSVITAGADVTVQSLEPQGMIGPQFTHISYLNSRLSITPSGEAICRGAVALYNSSHTVELTIELQKLDGTQWIALRSWTVSGSGPFDVEIERSHYVTSGTYRVLTTAKVLDKGILVETGTSYSPVTTY